MILSFWVLLVITLLVLFSKNYISFKVNIPFTLYYVDWNVFEIVVFTILIITVNILGILVMSLL